MGAFKGATFSEQEALLANGDALLLYTDGISEARDAQRGFFGEDRLKAAFAAAGNCHAEEIVRGLVTAVDKFTGSVDQADDLTLLVAKRI